MSEEEVLDKIIKEQDLVCYYTYNDMDKCVKVFDKYIDDPEIMYSDLSLYIFKHENILEKFSINNLFTLLSKSIDDHEKELLNELIMKKIDKEQFFCEDISTSGLFMNVSHSTQRGFNQVSDENIEKIRNQFRNKLPDIKEDKVNNIIDNLVYLSDVTNFLGWYDKQIFTDEKYEVIEEMINQDENALQYVNFGIFQDDIFKLGKDFVKYISKFPSISYNLVLLQKHNPKLIDVIGKKLNEYENIQDSFEELEILITYCMKNCFNIQIDKIDEQVVENLSECAIRDSKELGMGYNKSKQTTDVINIGYSENFKEKINEKYEEIYASVNSLEEKKNIYFNKFYSLSIDGAKKLLEEYGEDLENIEEIDEKQKQIFKNISYILELQDEKEIDKLYREENKQYSSSEILKMRSKIAKECAKTYTEQMKKVDSKIESLTNEENEEYVKYIDYNGKKVKQVKLDGNFDMLIHSTDTGFIEYKYLEENVDFAKLWKEGKNKENHIISTAFINQDFIGVPPTYKSGVRYGFTSINSEKIRLMGVTDINTYSNQFAYSSETKQYMSAKTMPYNSRRVYSEFSIEREGTLPNYVVLFDDDIEEVKENAYKAASQFDIPIIYIDKREIEQQQIQRSDSLINKFKETKDVEILKQLINCYETNVAGWLLNRSKDEADASHTEDIDNSRFEEDFKTQWNKIENVVNEYLVSAKDNKNQSVEELVNIMEIVLKENELYKQCEEEKPISKTHISFDVKGVVQKVNEAFENIGENEYKINIEEMPTVKQYQLTIKEVIKNALGGKKRVNIQDVEAAENFKNALIMENEKDLGEAQENE